MEEKRNSKRLDLDVTIELNHINAGAGGTDIQHINVETVDLSKSGIGFISSEKLEVESFYNTKFQIWTKEVINTVIKIVRRVETENGYRYGAFFVGMTEKTKLKIGIYEILNDFKENKMGEDD